VTFPAAVLAALKPRERVLLRLKALIGPAATGKTVFVECLSRVSSGGPGWNHATLTPTLQSLRAQGLLTEDLTCTPELLHLLAVEAIDSVEGAAMVEAIRAKLPLDNPQVWDRKLIEDAGLRWQRLAVLVNDEEEFQRAINYRHRYGLHMNDLGYRCLAHAIAQAIEKAAGAAAVGPLAHWRNLGRVGIIGPGRDHWQESPIAEPHPCRRRRPQSSRGSRPEAARQAPAKVTGCTGRGRRDCPR
jgi:hypothetical protein